MERLDGKDNEPVAIKLVLVGESSVGKSSIAMRFKGGSFSNAYSPNVDITCLGGLCFEKNLVIDKKVVKLSLWDTAGEEKFYCLAQYYYRGAQVGIVVFDVTNNESFIRAQKWVEELQGSSSDFLIALVGNKIDLHRKVAKEDAYQYAIIKGVHYFEVSAKKNSGIDELFSEVAKLTLESELPDPLKDSFQIGTYSKKKSSSSCSC